MRIALLVVALALVIPGCTADSTDDGTTDPAKTPQNQPETPADTPEVPADPGDAPADAPDAETIVLEVSGMT